ncbi:aldo/keto reductase [Phyllobacterium sp. SB3]|uniref:aldo/keto reductase n=1 Tax=Phyllobacterium sp. SB3 TaxID=3156073 RepID=UPI0032AE86F6
MQYIKFGNTNLKVSRLCLGAMGFGAATWRRWVLDRQTSDQIVGRALELGINFFDTCDFYSAGESENILREVLVKRVPRDSVVLATKAGNPMAPHCNGRGYSRKHLFEAIDASLRRLGTDHIDLFQTHIWDSTTDLDELVDAFGDIVRSGKALYVGAATMPAWSMALTLSKAAAGRLPSFASMQCEYNPAHRECERELLPLCRHEGLALIPFSPMARGFLAEDRREPGNSTIRTQSDDYTLKHYYRPSDFAVFEAVTKVAARLDTTAAQVSLAWTLAQPGITSPIFGATKVEHVDAAVAALDIHLSTEDIALIGAAYAPRPLSEGGH